MINIAIIDTHPLKILISKKQKILEMNIANNLTFAHEHEL